jgi:sigma-B regulation protein RsbU (phosphoserine phosphatase)
MKLGDIGIAGTYRPALKEAEVGGDFYDVFELPDGRFALVMGDVSGKGLQAAVHTATAKYMLRAYAHQNPNPDYVMSNLNEAMCAYTPESLFVTVFYGVLDPQNRTMTYSNAGHDEPLFFVRSLGCVLPLDITGRAIGVISGSMYGQRLLEFNQGDIVMIYTDGITDARSEGKFFGIDGLSRVLTANIDRDEQAIANIALNAAEELAGGSLRDDAAVLVVKTRIGAENVD